MVEMSTLLDCMAIWYNGQQLSGKLNEPNPSKPNLTKHNIT